jgi:hypothetical protein
VIGVLWIDPDRVYVVFYSGDPDLCKGPPAVRRGIDGSSPEPYFPVVVRIDADIYHVWTRP